ncbi:MAG: PAS domain S-box protein, partial [Pseudomonadota bacterium]|nr:PAS domain S-box protein [Pseudomonadota bacterium]
VRHQQGHYRWILVQAAALWDQYQQPQRLVSTWIDITQRRQIEQALQASEALLSAIFEVTQIGLCITDEQGRFVRVNPAYCRLFNYTAEELVGAHFTKVLPPDHHERALKLHHAFLSGDPKVDTEGEWRIVNRAGECMDISFTMGLLTQSNGQRFRVTTITDITKRKRLELERNRLFNLSVDMQAIIGFELDFKEVNAAWKHVLGWSKTELLEHSPMDFVHPDDQVAAFEALQQLQQGETIFNFEVRYLCQDKYYKWLSWNIYPLVDQQTLYAVIRDVTEHKRAEEEIQRQQVFIRLVVDSVPHLIFIKDHQGHFIFFNRSLTDLLGLQPPAVAELTDSPSMMTERCSKAEIQVLEQKEEVTLEESCCTPEGEARWFYMIKKPFVQDNGEIAVLSVGTDITQRKQHEEALRQSESRYRAIVQDQIDLVCRFLPNGNLTFVNYAFCRYFDRPEPELAGQNFLNFLPAHEQENFKQQLQQLTTAAPVMTYEHRLQLSGKQQIHWQHWFIRAMFNSYDRIMEYQAVGRDITERKQTEEALRQSEERLRFVTSAAPVILFALDTEGFFTFARGKALSLLNLTNDEVVGSSVFDIFAQFPQELTYIRRTLAGETVTTLMNFPNVVLEMKLTPLLNEAQQVEGVIGISVDMTTRHALEVQLKETVAELETILDNSVIGIAYVKNGVFIWVNSKLEDLLAFKPQ